MQDSTDSVSGYYRLQEFAERHNGILTEHTLRYQARDRDSNNLGAAFVRMGRCLLIHEETYFRLLDQQRQKVA
jgi:hypothetical protein